MIIRNALVYTENHTFEKKNVMLSEGKIVSFPETAKNDEEVLDGEGKYLVPGLLDLHFHGADGVDFCDGTVESLKKLAAFELRHGMLNICPASMTVSEEDLTHVMTAAKQFRENVPQDGAYASLVGINLEGPFVSRKKLGAQNPEYVLSPDTDVLNRLQALSGGLIKLVDLAPEEDDSGFVEENKDRYVLSLAHSVSDYETAKAAFTRGVKHVTHLFNAMQGIHHREPGPVLAALEAHAEVELITDGLHLHPAIVRMVFELFDEDRIILVSDSMQATGLPDGSYELGRLPVTKEGRKAVLTSDMTTLAGSATPLFDCMRTAVLEMNIPLEKAIRAATENPARCLSLDDHLGKIKEGYDADLLLLNPQLEIETIIHKGNIIKGEMHES